MKNYKTVCKGYRYTTKVPTCKEREKHSVSPDMDPNCLQRLSADNKVFASKERVKGPLSHIMLLLPSADIFQN